jgi:isochorismate synthase
MLGLGRVRVVETGGRARFREASDAARRLWQELEVLGDPGPVETGPLLLGGFAFSPELASEGAWADFPAGRLVLPELLLLERDGDLWLTATAAERSAIVPTLAGSIEQLFGQREAVPHDCADYGTGEKHAPSGRRAVGESDGALAAGMTAGPEYRVRADRSHRVYRAQVETARQAITSGDLEKVVLARSLLVQHDGRFDVAGLLDRLARIYPSCVTFAISVPGARFLGATPELLVARRGAAVHSSAVAGSAPRGRTPEEDERLGRALRENKKEQEEHAIVVRGITGALGEPCASLEFPESPRLLRLEGIQHLETPIAGTLRAGEPKPSVLELGGRLHPTPAVSGSPAPAACDWIFRSEGMERGWYAGAIGFVDRGDGGELRVALRSGLVRSRRDGDSARLYAGGGIVADSDPERELEETRVKLRALLAPLTEI